MEWTPKLFLFLLLSFSISGLPPLSIGAGGPVPQASSTTGSPAPNLIPIPQPNLNAVEAAVRDQIAEASSELQAVSKKAGVSREELGEVYGQMGEVYQAYSLSDAAEACYKNALFLIPYRFDWNYYLGILYVNMGQVKTAIPYLQKAQELRPNQVPVLVHLADVYVMDGQTGPAKTLYEKALTLDGSLAAAMAGLGKIFLANGDYPSAIRFLEEALKLQPQALSLHYPLAMAYRKAGDIANAIAQLKQQGRGEARVPDPFLDDLESLKKGQWMLRNRGTQALAEGRYADAAKIFDQMAQIQGDPFQVTAIVYLGIALAQEGKLNEAVEQYQRVLRLQPNTATAHYDLGVILLQLGEGQEAIEHFQTALAIDPTYKMAHFQLANLFMRTGRYEEAVVHYQKVIELSPDNQFAHLMKAMAFVRVKRYSEAKVELEADVVSFPENTDFAIALVRLLAACPDKAIRDGPRALGLIDKLVKSNPSPDFELVETYGMALASVGRFSEAADLQKRMIEAVKSSQREDLAEALERNLRLYEHQEACSLPWQDDDPIFAPQPGKMMLQVPNTSGVMGNTTSSSR